MANLITYSDFSNYRDISSNISAAKRIDPYILEAQEIDIRSLLGDIFYNEVVSNPSNYSTLLNGGTYDYDGYTYSFKGLKAVHVYFAYARFVMNDDVKSTPSGMVNKLNQNSERVTEATINRISRNARDIASAYWQQCYDFLCLQTDSIYNNWEGKRKTNGQIEITAID